MKTALFVQGAGDRWHPEGSGHLIAAVAAGLGAACQVIAPDMPGAEDPHYLPWRQRIEAELARIDDEPVLVGHSLGASVLLKCLAEGVHPGAVAGLFLVSTPFWGKDQDWKLEWALPDDFATRLPPIGRIVLYHSRHDPQVPFAHLGRYASALPAATVRALEGESHSFNEGLPELVADILGL